MCLHPPSAHLLRSSQRAAPSPHRKGPRCNKLGHEGDSGVETAHGFIFVAVFDYLQSERLKYGYNILTSWRQPGFLLTCAFDQLLADGASRARARAPQQLRRRPSPSGKNRRPRSTRSARPFRAHPRGRRLAGFLDYRIRTCSEPDLRCPACFRP